MTKIAGDWGKDAFILDEENPKPNREYLASLIPYLIISGALIAVAYISHANYPRQNDANEKKDIRQGERESGKEGLKNKIQDTSDIRK